MKRTIFTLSRITVFAAALILAIATQTQAQESGLLMLSKNFNGAITRTSAEISLSSNAECDQTKNFIPDGSKLVTLSFVMNTDANGVGTFSGNAQVVTPDGRAVLQGSLRGTVGINSRCGQNKSCRLPWHLEGLFESVSSSAERVLARAASDLRIMPMVLNFSADLNTQTASPLPIYQGRLDGLVPSLPASIDRITIATDKTGYTVNDVMTAVVINDSPETIQTFDKRAFCTILQFQVLDGNQWNDTAFCPFKAPSLPVNIAPGQKFEVPLQPTLSISPLNAGIYRLALTFRFLSGNTPISDSYTVFSSQFRLAAQAPSNLVIAKPDRSVYQESEQVVALITNDTAQPIVTTDQKSFCSIVNAQKLAANNNWTNSFPCLLAAPSRPVRLAAREEVIIKLPKDIASPKLSEGTYRLEFTYWTTDAGGNPTGNPITVYSSTFNIVAKE
jgi:hypothetical protein